MSARYCYCGVTFDSEVPLPGVPVGEAGTPAELEVRLGSTPAQLPDEQRRTATFAHNGREALWWIEGIGRFHVSHGGRLVTMSPAEAVDGVDEAALRLDRPSDEGGKYTHRRSDPHVDPDDRACRCLADRLGELRSGDGADDGEGGRDRDQQHH